MYTSPEDARSDLLLSVGVYLFGDVIIGILFSSFLDIPVLGPVLRIVFAVATTALVPLLLIRYRHESLRSYGVAPERTSSLVAGALAMVPLVVATLLLVLLGIAPSVILPVRRLIEQPLPGIAELVQWVGTAFLAAYATMKARDAFRSDRRTIRDSSMEIGRVIVIVLAVSALILVLANTVGWVTAVVLPLGAVASLVWALQTVRGPSATGRAVLLTPTVVLALRAFNLTFDGGQFFGILWLTGITALIGLVIGIYTETRNSAMAAIGIGLVVGLFTSV